MLTVKKIFINITRNKARSLILAAFSFLTVLFAGIYFGNLEQNQNLLAALGEKIPVIAAVTNSTGDRQAGLDITEKRIEMFLGLGLEDYTVTAESYGNNGGTNASGRTAGCAEKEPNIGEGGERMAEMNEEEMDQDHIETDTAPPDTGNGQSHADYTGIPVTYYPINENAARRAKEMNSFFDYVPGSATRLIWKQEP